MKYLARVCLVWAFLALASLACDVGGVPGLGPVESSPTPTGTPTATPTPTATSTPVIAPTRIVSPTPDWTKTPTLTPSFTPASSITPSFTPTDTPGPQDATPASCPPPAGGFSLVYASDPALQAALGCPASHHPEIPPEAWAAQGAFQPFENGLMVWVSRLGWYEQKVIYVLFNNGSYRRYDDRWQDGVDPESGGESPPAGRVEPVRGFGKVWRDNPDVRAALGWALQPEQGGEGRIQLFVSGEMVYLSMVGQTYIFMHGPPGRWQVSATPF